MNFSGPACVGPTFGSVISHVTLSKPLSLNFLTDKVKRLNVSRHYAYSRLYAACERGAECVSVWVLIPQGFRFHIQGAQAICTL